MCIGSCCCDAFLLDDHSKEEYTQRDFLIGGTHQFTFDNALAGRDGGGGGGGVGSCVDEHITNEASNQDDHYQLLVSRHSIQQLAVISSTQCLVVKVSLLLLPPFTLYRHVPVFCQYCVNSQSDFLFFN